MWDFVAARDAPIVSQSLSGRVITGIYAQELFTGLQQRRRVVLADYNGALRIWLAPEDSVQTRCEGIEWMRGFVERQIRRVSPRRAERF